MFPNSLLIALFNLIFSFMLFYVKEIGSFYMVAGLKSCCASSHYGLQVGQIIRSCLTSHQRFTKTPFLLSHRIRGQSDSSDYQDISDPPQL